MSSVAHTAKENRGGHNVRQAVRGAGLVHAKSSAAASAASSGRRPHTAPAAKERTTATAPSSTTSAAAAPVPMDCARSPAKQPQRATQQTTTVDTTTAAAAEAMQVDAEAPARSLRRTTSKGCALTQPSLVAVTPAVPPAPLPQQQPLQTPSIQGSSSSSSSSSSSGGCSISSGGGLGTGAGGLSTSSSVPQRCSQRRPRCFNPLVNRLPSFPDIDEVAAQQSPASDSDDAQQQQQQQLAALPPLPDAIPSSSLVPQQQQPPPPQQQQPVVSPPVTFSPVPQPAAPAVHQHHHHQQQQPAPAMLVPQQPRQQHHCGTRIDVFRQISAQAGQAVAVNGRMYIKLDVIGRGGSSKVYKVIGPELQILALKRVNLQNTDPSTVESYINEIELLRRLKDNPMVIRLVDAEIHHHQRVIDIVLEYGEVDLANLLRVSDEGLLDINTIRVFWQQMLRAVKTIHEERIVHGDLKPANFVMVRGVLKLIDFGIAKQISQNTTHIERDSQIGTLNYISPEALGDMGSPNPALIKVGRASDVWSLGCILYQMQYGRPPFHHLQLMTKVKCIPDPNYKIDLAPRPGALPALVDVLARCLQRDPTRRPTIDALLAHPLLAGEASAPPFCPKCPHCTRR